MKQTYDEIGKTPCPICDKTFLRIGNFGDCCTYDEFRIVCDYCGYTSNTMSSDYGEVFLDYMEDEYEETIENKYDAPQYIPTFKGKNSSGVWVESTSIIRHILSKDEETIQLIDEFNTKHSIIPKTLCFSVGIKDKNGNEVYNHDIVRCSTNYQNIPGTIDCEVVFADGEITLYQMDRDEYDGILIDLNNIVEVIGNIYDNYVYKGELK